MIRAFRQNKQNRKNSDKSLYSQFTMKYNFVPFENQRDNIGRIIQPKACKKSQVNAIQLFQNLKKSTQEYQFEKQYEKMLSKFQAVKRSIQSDEGFQKDDQYWDNRFQRIFDKAQVFRKKQRKPQKLHSRINFRYQSIDDLYSNQDTQVCENQDQKQQFFIDLQQKINTKIEGIRKGLDKRKILIPCENKTRARPKTQQARWRQIHQSIDFNSSSPPRTKAQLDLKKASKSTLMVNFCQQGKNYKHMINEKKFHPWKKWYKVDQIQIFPGKKLNHRHLDKSIYD